MNSIKQTSECVWPCWEEQDMYKKKESFFFFLLKNFTAQPKSLQKMQICDKNWKLKLTLFFNRHYTIIKELWEIIYSLCFFLQEKNDQLKKMLFCISFKQIYVPIIYVFFYIPPLQNEQLFLAYRQNGY